MLIAGILILSLAKNEKCDSGCVEKSCLAINYDRYPCDCGLTCQTKSAVVDGAYRLGVALLIIGIVGSIVGSLYLCINRRRYDRNIAVMQSPIGETVIMQEGGVSVVQGGGISIIQGVPMPMQYGQTSNVPGYMYTQGIPVGMPTNNPGGGNYGYPVQGSYMGQSPTQIIQYH